MDILGRWITAPFQNKDAVPVFLKSFKAEKRVARATLSITALGVYEAWLNGSRVGQFVLAPGWTSYAHRIQVQRYDVTALLTAHNELSVLVGSGWFASPIGFNEELKRAGLSRPRALLAWLSVEYEDGTKAVIGTDESWLCRESAIRKSEIYDGETFDATFVQPVPVPAQVLGYPYQIFADRESGRLAGVTDLLMMPEYLLYRLCGVRAREYTNATTTGLVNAQTGAFDMDIVSSLGLPEHLFPALRQPGTVIGEYEGIACVLCATHDTASAVEGIPMDGSQPYISSGTWSLLGVKTEHPLTDAASEAANYSNEGGVGYNRYQKNIMGMWLVNELRRDLCPDTPFGEIVAAAQASDCALLVDANAPAFLSPVSMKAAFDAATGNRLRTPGDYFRCAYRSLAASYRDALSELERNTGKTYEKLYIVGGGAKNAFLNALTAEATGKEVVALPIEATALGNLKIQMEASV